MFVYVDDYDIVQFDGGVVSATCTIDPKDSPYCKSNDGAGFELSLTDGKRTAYRITGTIAPDDKTSFDLICRSTKVGAWTFEVRPVKMEGVIGADMYHPLPPIRHVNSIPDIPDAPSYTMKLSVDITDANVLRIR